MGKTHQRVQVFLTQNINWSSFHDRKILHMIITHLYDPYVIHIYMCIYIHIYIYIIYTCTYIHIYIYIYIYMGIIHTIVTHSYTLWIIGTAIILVILIPLPSLSCLAVAILRKCWWLGSSFFMPKNIGAKTSYHGHWIAGLRMFYRCW